ncbi:hypothetical protein EUTSA_v10002936mg, partial [Eutrema salsugineum]
QIQVEAACCRSLWERNRYSACRFAYLSIAYCAEFSGCKIVDGKCPPGYDYEILENSGDTAHEYCKLGCASSVCGALFNLQKSDASEIVKGVAEECTKACSTLCTKGFVKTAVETSKQA